MTRVSLRGRNAIISQGEVRVNVGSIQGKCWLFSSKGNVDQSSRFVRRSDTVNTNLIERGFSLEERDEFL